MKINVNIVENFIDYINSHPLANISTEFAKTFRDFESFFVPTKIKTKNFDILPESKRALLEDIFEKKLNAIVESVHTADSHYDHATNTVINKMKIYK
jgi:hypothetical protein